MATTTTDKLIRGAIWAVLCTGIALITWSVVFPAPTPTVLVDAPDAGQGVPDGAASEYPTVPDPTAAPETIVYVTGAVERPGLYALTSDARVGTAVTAAGGLTPDAAYEHVNMAAHISDAAHIHIPRRDEDVAVTAPPAPGAAGSALVSVNDADATQLASLPGVGASLAERIIAYRTEHGPFASLADLDAVSGIGSALLRQLEPLVRF